MHCLEYFRMKNNKRHKDRVLVKKDVCFCIQEIAIHRRLVRSEGAKDPTNCYKCMSYATTKLTHCVFSVDVRSVGIWYGHTMTFSSEHCRRNTQDNHTAPTESKNVCARNTSRGLDYWGLKKQLSKPRLDQNCYDKTWSTRSQVRFVRSGKFPLRSDVRWQWIFGSHLNVAEIIVETMFQSTLTTYSITNSSINHSIETTTKKMSVFVVVSAWSCPLLSSVLLHVLWQSSFAGWFSLYCFTDRATFTLCLISSLPESFCSRDWSDLWHSSWSSSSSLFRASQLRSSQFLNIRLRTLNLKRFVLFERATHLLKETFFCDGNCDSIPCPS